VSGGRRGGDHDCRKVVIGADRLCNCAASITHLLTCSVIFFSSMVNKRSLSFRRATVLGQFKSLRVVFPAACGEFVIPAEAGIRSDSPHQVLGRLVKHGMISDTPLLEAG
jgi:hypothetical protein